MAKVYVQIPFKPPRTRTLKLVPCPCCSTPASKLRPEEWYHDRKLVRPVQMAGKRKGTMEWQCILCRNKREVTPAKAMTFILTTL